MIRLHRERRLTAGEARRGPPRLRLLPLGLGLLGIVTGWDVAEFFHHGVARRPTEQGQLGLGRVVQDGAGALALSGDQSITFLMDDLEDRAPPQEIVVSGGSADVDAALPRGLIAHLIADRIAEILSDGELVGRIPGGRGWDLHRVIAVVTDPGPLDGDCAEGGLEGERSCPAALDAVATLAVPALQDQFVVGLLDEGAEEPALDLEAGVMDARLDLVGEMLVLVGQGQAHLQLEFE